MRAREKNILFLKYLWIRKARQVIRLLYNYCLIVGNISFISYFCARKELK